MPVQGLLNIATGGSGIIGQTNRARLLWGGRADTKRLRMRIDALEENQKTILARAESNQGDRAPDQIQTLQEAQKAKTVNPLNVKNITIMQVNAGDSKKDVLYAHKVTEHNTRLLEQFAKSTKEIAKNTKNIVDQDTKIKKEKTFKERAQAGVEKAKKVALKQAAKGGGAVAMIFEKMKEMLPSLILAALASALGVSIVAVSMGIKAAMALTRAGVKGIKNIAAARARKREIMTWIDMKTKPLKMQIGGIKAQLRMLQAEMLVCCGLGGKRKKSTKRKGGRKGGGKGTPEKTTQKPKTLQEKMKSAHQAGKKKTAQGIVEAGKKSKGYWAKLIIKKIGMKGVGAVGLLAAAGSFFSPLLAAGLTAWFIYDVIKMAAVGLGFSEEAIENMESAIWDTITNFTGMVWSAGATAVKRAIVAPPKTDKEKFTAVSGRNKAKRLKIIAKKKEELDELRLELHDAIEDEESNIAQLQKKMLALDISYNKIATREGMPIYVRTINGDNRSGIFSSKGGNQWVIKEKMWYMGQLELAQGGAKYIPARRAERKIEKKWDEAGKAVKSEKNVTSITSKISSAFTSTVAGLMSGGKSIQSALGMKVDGVAPAAWDGLNVDKGFRKVIDAIENGGTGSYTTKGRRSSAYGRYQFMESTAKEVARKVGISEAEWKSPVNQDKLFQQFTNDNKRRISGISGVAINVWTMWLAHNLGSGSIKFMSGLTDTPYKGALIAINNQLHGNKAPNVLEARSRYVAQYGEKIGKILSGAGPSTSKGSSFSTGASGGFAGGGIAGMAASIFGSVGTAVNLAQMDYASAGSLYSGGSNLAEAAGSFVGKIPYVWGAGRGGESGVLMNGASGYDCSSFVAMVVQKKLGIPANKFGTVVVQQYKYMTRATNALRVRDKEAQPGDIIFFWNQSAAISPGHVGIVTGPNSMIHNSGGSKNTSLAKRGKGVIKAGWGNRKHQIFRFKNADTKATNVATGAPAQQVITDGSDTNILNNTTSPSGKQTIMEQVVAAQTKVVQETKQQIQEIGNQLAKVTGGKSTQPGTVKISDSATLPSEL